MQLEPLNQPLPFDLANVADIKQPSPGQVIAAAEQFGRSALEHASHLLIKRIASLSRRAVADFPVPIIDEPID